MVSNIRRFRYISAIGFRDTQNDINPILLVDIGADLADVADFADNDGRY